MQKYKKYKKIQIYKNKIKKYKNTRTQKNTILKNTTNYKNIQIMFKLHNTDN